MINSLDTYNYEEQLVMKPRVFEVAISDLDKVIKIMEDGSLLAELGLDLSDGILTLTGKEGIDVASVELPGSQSLKGGIYDKATQEMVLYIINSDSSESEIRIDVTDLIDVYQNGNGIEIDEEKRIHIKIKDSSNAILDVNDEGLGINLSDYATVVDLIAEKEIRGESDLQLEEKIFSVSENLTIESTERKGFDSLLDEKINLEIGNRFDADQSILNTLDGKVPFTKAIKDGVEYNTIQLDNHANLLGGGTDGGTYNLAMVSKWDVADFGSSSLHTNLNSKDKVTVNDSEVIAYMSDLDYLSSGVTVDLTIIKSDVSEIKTDLVEMKDNITAINGEIVIIKDDISTLKSGLEAEIVARKDGDLSLEDKIFVEQNRAITVEDVLAIEIEGIKPRVSELEDNKVPYTKTIKEGNEIKNIALDNNASLLAMSNGGKLHNIAMLSNTNNLEMGTVSMPMNLRSSDRITVNYSEKLAYVSELNGSSTELLGKIEENKLAIETEVDRAISAEDALANELISQGNSLNDEITRATTAEQELDNVIKGEITRATTAEQGLDNAIKGESTRAIDVETSLDNKINTKVSWTDISTTRDTNRKAIILDNNDIILGKTTEGHITPLIFMNKWNVVDAGASSVQFNINTPLGIRPTVQEAGQTGDEANKIAYLSDIEKIEGEKVSAVTLKQDLANPLKYSLIVDGINKGDINIPKDQFLSEARYDSDTKELVFIFVTTTGENEVRVDVSSLIDLYTAGEGLKLDLNTFSIDVNIVATKVNLDAAISDFKAADAILTDKLTEEVNRAIGVEEELKNEKVSWTEVGVDGRKTIVLKNNDMLLGTDTNGITYNVSMISKWNVVDLGTSSLHLNLNSIDVPTVQLPGQSGDEAKHIAFAEDMTDVTSKIEAEYKAADAILSDMLTEEVNRATSVENELKNDKVSWNEVGVDGRKTIVLKNNDMLLGSDTASGTYNLAMINKWDVADFGSSSLHSNINSIDVPTVQLPGQSGDEAKHIAFAEDVEVAIGQVELEYKEAITDLTNTVTDNQAEINTKVDASVSELEDRIEETLIEGKLYTDDKVKYIVDGVESRIDAKVDPLKSKFNNYLTTEQVNKEIDDVLAASKTYTDEEVAKGVASVTINVDNKITTAITASEQKVNVNVIKNSNDIIKLSTGLGNIPYVGGVGIVDDVYKKVHDLIKGLDEGNLEGYLKALEGGGVIADKGIEIVEKKISVLIDPLSENYLTVSKDGLMLSGIDNVITTETEERVESYNILDNKIASIELKRDDIDNNVYGLLVDGLLKGEINIPKDNFLKEVIYDDTTNEIVFTFITESGETETRINISGLVDTYTAGEGLKLETNEFSIQIDPTTERYITISNGGIKIVGIDELITETKDSLLDEISTVKGGLDEEIIRATDAEASIVNDLLDESTTARTAEKANADAIEEEVTRAKLVESNKIDWISAITVEKPNRKAIVLDNENMLLGGDTANITYNLAMINKWDVADFGSSSLHTNLNSKDRPTVQLPGVSGENAEGIAYLSDIIESEKVSADAIEEEKTRAEGVEANKIDWTSAITVEKPNRKAIVLDNENMLLGGGTDSGTYNLAMINKWDVADFGSSSLHSNINSKDRPTVQLPGVSGEDAETIAYLSDITTSEKLNADAIIAETESRIEEDAIIIASINQEITNREEGDEKLAQDLLAETLMARNAEQGITDAVNSEIERASIAETVLQETIETEVNERTLLFESVNEAIVVETTARDNADAALRTDLNEEVTLARANELANKEAIELESGIREEEDVKLSEAIAAESVTARAAEKVNADAIEEEKTRAEGVETILRTDVDKLRVDIDYESTRALGAEANINVALDSKVSWDESNSKIVLPSGGQLVGTKFGDNPLEGGVIAQLNQWDVMDFGSPKYPLNLNVPDGVRATVQEKSQSGAEANKIAYLSDMETLITATRVNNVGTEVSDGNYLRFTNNLTKETIIDVPSPHETFVNNSGMVYDELTWLNEIFGTEKIKLDGNDVDVNSLTVDKGPYILVSMKDYNDETFTLPTVYAFTMKDALAVNFVKRSEYDALLLRIEALEAKP